MQIIKCWDIQVWDGGDRHNHRYYVKTKEAAEKGKRGIMLRDDFWGNGGYSSTKEWQQAVMILEGDGYKVGFFYKESQFVDMGTQVEW